MRELEEIFDKVGRAGSYAALWFTVDTADPERGALLQQVQERGAEIETSLIFFELEWNELPDEQAEALLEADELEFCRHHLRTARRYRPHQLTEPEERILTETEVTGPLGVRAPLHRADLERDGRAARRGRARAADGGAQPAPGP